MKQRSGRRVTYFLVKWEGYEQPTWEPQRNLHNCQEKIDAFRAQRNASNGDEEEDKEDDMEDEGDEEVENERKEEDEDCEKGPINRRASFEGDIDEDYECEEEHENESSESDEPPSAPSSTRAQSTLPKSRAKRGSRALNKPRRGKEEGFLDSDVSDGDEDNEVVGDDLDTADVVVQNEIDDDVDEQYEALLADTVAGQHKDLKSDFLRDLAVNGFTPTYYGEDLLHSASAATLYEGSPAVTSAGASAARSKQPIDLFFFFLPKTLWKKIADESNRYEEQTRGERKRQLRSRLQRKYSRQIAAEKFSEAQRQITQFDAILPHEILIMMGLLIARSLCPMKTNLEHHWSSSQNGAVPAGTWSRFMSRQRFRDISRFLHFSDNKNPMAKQDRAWKIRPVVATLQQTFLRGMTFGRWIAFDEMVIPSKSSRNAVRIYLKNKPHKYGTKLFAVCCGETNYCARIEVYCGSRQDNTVVDTMCGPAAVLRNLRAVWPVSTIDRSQMRVVITDREYTCVALAVRLYAMGFCSIGTVTTSRLGFPKEIVYPFKTVPKRLSGQRGLCQLRRCTKFSNLYACSWLDNKPVYFLACGVSTQKTALLRKEKNGGSVEIGCPEFVVSYNRYMNGVDAHDQLRLQRYSVQRSLVSKKYYKSLFFGLFDMALVNAYIVHQQYCKSISEKPMSHAEFRLLLHTQLINLTEEAFEEIATSSTASSPASIRTGSGSVTSHHLEISDDKQPCGKVRYRVCKVCSLLNTDRSMPIGKSRAYCHECSTEKSRVYLCDRIRSTGNGNHMTCFQIWHQLWRNGTVQPGERKIRMRAGYNWQRLSDVSIRSSISYDFS